MEIKKPKVAENLKQDQLDAIINIGCRIIELRPEHISFEYALEKAALSSTTILAIHVNCMKLDLVKFSKLPEKLFFDELFDIGFNYNFKTNSFDNGFIPRMKLIDSDAVLELINRWSQPKGE